VYQSRTLGRCGSVLFTRKLLVVSWNKIKGSRWFLEQQTLPSLELAVSKFGFERHVYNRTKSIKYFSID